MECLEFSNLVRRTYPNQGLRLRFDKLTGIIGLNRLKLLCENNADICIDERDTLIVLAILVSNDWDGDHNRTITVLGLCNAENAFLYEIARDVEFLELAETHGARGLMVKRQKSRDESISAIIDGVLISDLIREVEEWGLMILGQYTEFLETPAVQFMICKPDGELILRVILDGWTGHYGIDGGIGDDLYQQPKQIQDYIRVNLAKRLDELTAIAA